MTNSGPVGGAVVVLLGATVHWNEKVWRLWDWGGIPFRSSVFLRTERRERVGRRFLLKDIAPRWAWDEEVRRRRKAKFYFLLIVGGGAKGTKDFLLLRRP